MFKIWAKIMKNHKLVKDIIYTNYNSFNGDDFFEYVMEICKELDIETPIILNKHLNYLEEFNSTKFDSSDFIDKVKFDFLVLENVKE
jgi:MinD superfamily P-loop ATPase